MKQAKTSEMEEKGIKEAFASENRSETAIDHQEDIIKEPSPEFEAHHNLIGLFEILLQVGRRVDPEKYGSPMINTEQV